MKNFCSDMVPPRLMLGTVQLGMPYGIANDAGVPDVNTANFIVDAAIRNGIRYFDTAQAYGDSEAVLGAALGRLGMSSDVFVTTKLAAALDPLNHPQIHTSIDESLNRLRIDRLWCLMLHDPSWLSSWDSGLGDLLREEQARGRVEHLGVSLRTPDDAPTALACIDIAALQVPCNAWDRRMEERGHLADARRLGKLCCVRSVYLQGLLVLDPEAVAGKLPRAHAASLRWWALARDLGMPVQELAMRYALTLNAPLVVGAESVAQLEESVALASRDPLTAEVTAKVAGSMTPLIDPEIVEPFRWTQGK